MKRKQIFIVFFAMLFVFAYGAFAEEEKYDYNSVPADSSTEYKSPFDFDSLVADKNIRGEKTGISCFDYYTFQSVQVNVVTQSDSYTAKDDKVDFVGNLVNENNQPITDGNVFVRILNKGTGEDWNVVDEFFGLQNISLQAKEKKQANFSWHIPKGLEGGKYEADFFFTVGKKFNLGGLPFSNEVIVGKTYFTINSDNKGTILFNREETKVNGEKYNHIGNWPTIKQGEKVQITQPLKNTSDENEDVVITYDLYYWDSLNESDKISSKTENITIPANSEKELKYVIPSMDKSVYYLKITAETQKEQKAIVNIRVVSEQEQPRLNYPAITEFPIRKGDNVTLFSCFHNTSGKNTEGKVEVVLKDKKDKTISKMTYKGVIPSAMSADKVDFKAKKDYDFVKLQATVYDKNNNVVDKYETVYDCKDFNACKTNDKKPGMNQNSKQETKSKFIAILGVFFALLAVIVTVVVIFKTKRNVNK